jgi:hypothetical protein
MSDLRSELAAPDGYVPSATQLRVLKLASRMPNSHIHIGGHGMAPYLQAARALTRRGYLCEFRTSSFALLDKGGDLLRDTILAEMRQLDNAEVSHER